MKRLILAFSLAALLAGPVSAQDVFNVQGNNHCPNPGNGVSRFLSAGIHYVTLTGGVSYWSWDGDNGGKTWVSYVIVRDLSSGVDYSLNPGTGWQPTRAASEAQNAGVVYTFEMAAAGEARFYISDGGGCGDNRSYVTVTLDDLTVENSASTWGALKSTYR